MTISIIDYSERAIAVVGDTKSIKDQLKELGGRFNFRLSCGAGWVFPKSKQADVEAVIGGGSVSISKDAPAERVKIAKVNDLALMDEYLEGKKAMWGHDNRMMDYHRKKVSGIYKLSDGSLWVFDKPTIETSFCYSEGSTRSMEDATKLCHNARTNEQHFIDSNTRDIDRLINDITDTHSTREMYLYSESYRDKRTNVSNTTFMTDWEAKENRFHFENLRKISDADKDIVLNACRNELAKFTKRLNTYLKRYGLSKVSSWTYWADR